MFYRCHIEKKYNFETVKPHQFDAVSVLFWIITNYHRMQTKLATLQGVRMDPKFVAFIVCCLLSAYFISKYKVVTIFHKGKLFIELKCKDSEALNMIILPHVNFNACFLPLIQSWSCDNRSHIHICWNMDQLLKIIRSYSCLNSFDNKYEGLTCNNTAF